MSEACRLEVLAPVSIFAQPDHAQFGKGDPLAQTDDGKLVECLHG